MIGIPISIAIAHKLVTVYKNKKSKGQTKNTF